MKKKLKHPQINKVELINHKESYPTRCTKESSSGLKDRTLESNSNPHEEIKAPVKVINK